MERIFTGWRTFLGESEGARSYYQDTFDIFALASISKSLGGTRDQTKNDIRAIPEVLTVVHVDPPAGIQRTLPDSYLSTLKIHCRLTREGLTSIALGREIIKQIQQLSGVKILRYDIPAAPVSENTLAERDFQAAKNSPEGRAEYARDKEEYIGSGPQAPGVAYPQKASSRRGKSAPPAVGGGLEEGGLRAPLPDKREDPPDIGIIDAEARRPEPEPAPPSKPTPVSPPPVTVPDGAANASLEDLGLGDVEDRQSFTVNPSSIHNKPADYREPMTSTARITSDFGTRTRPSGVVGAGLTQQHKAVDSAPAYKGTPASEGELERMRGMSADQREMEKAAELMDVSKREQDVARLFGDNEEEQLYNTRRELVAPVNLQILSVARESDASVQRREKTGTGRGAGNRVVYRYVDEDGVSHRGMMMHLGEFPEHLKPGDVYKSGQHLGITVGSTGGSTGPHLHHEVRPETPRELAILRKRGVDGNQRYGSKSGNVSYQQMLKRKRAVAQERALAARSTPEAPEPQSTRYASQPVREGKLKIKIRRRNKKLGSSFELQPELNPEIWNDSEMVPAIRNRLRQIALDFIDNLDLPGVEIKDIILTGSLANYNWSSYSDLDVHIVVDFREIDENEGFVKKYFDSVRANWNRVHNIKVKDFDVELYVQDDDEHHTSTGVYSLLRGEWEVVPTFQPEPFSLDNVFRKARPLIRHLETLEREYERGNYERAIEEGNKLKEKLQKMRKSGLESAGVFSGENLAFKVLRRGGYMKRLYDMTRAAYDASQTMADE
tara:strand:+ start:5209 stop:7548 length:2340 start_codon:yes stop_codon:yes gene_type:complete